MFSLIAALRYFRPFFNSDAANILAVFHTPSKSHLLLAQPLLFELVKSGHTVTVVSPFPSKNAPDGYVDVPIPEAIAFTHDHWKTIFDHVNDDYYTIITRMMKSCAVMTNNTLTHPNMKKLIKSRPKFDLLFVEVFFNDAFLGLANVFNCPVIAMSTVGMTPWANDYIGAPTPISHVHNGLLSFSDRMSLKEKFISLAVAAVERTITYFYHLPLQNQIFIENFPRAKKSLTDLRKETISILFLNSHDSLTAPRPYFGNVVQVGGMQIKDDLGELPTDIQQFMDEAEMGVILFAFGSNLRPSLMQNSTQKAILTALESLPYQIVLQWDDLQISLSDKFLVRKWIPQNLILKHPNSKLLITHGGLLSCFEAINYGVPILGIPIFGDQFSNVEMAVRGGWGMNMQYNDITFDGFRMKLVEILENPVYQKRMKNVSKLYRDQVVSPLDLAKYWVEYVIEHKGANHLRSAVLDLRFYQYYNFDVLAVCAVFLLAVMWLVNKVRHKLSCLLHRKLKEKLI